MDVVLWITIATTIVIGLIIALIFRPSSGKKADTAPVEGTENEGSTDDHANRQGAADQGGRRRAANQNRGLRAQLQASRRARLARISEDENDDEYSEEDEEFGIDEVTALTTGKIGAKKLRRMQAKAEKKALREQEESLREDRKRREAEREETRRAQEEKRKKQEELEAEEAKRKKEEQEQQELEEYLKLKESFVVEDEGVDAATEEESQQLLQLFIQHIKNAKVVQLEELAAEFNLRTQDAINRIQMLQESGDLTGVIDDRGKFIYISPEELKSIAQFVKQRGRVSISELASSSNSLVNLQPETTVVTA